ncbi:hypothetical protein HAZT_HAZT008977 [Hyalella azteca]|uniref:alkaline phosphatase n=1 Tax=Hyalella azteca TaxID=294128 RepID=A0A6A0HA70_HYAAZ|nr:hypothetical protein HAZT_HAZT008977 [Hyalella azteca]
MNNVGSFDASVSDLDYKPYTTLLYGNGPGYAHATPSGRHNITAINPQDVNFVQQAAVPRKYETHSGEDVPVYATGPGSYLFSGTVEQSYIPHAIAYASCISDDTSHCEKPPSDDASAAKSPHTNMVPNFPHVAPSYPNLAPNIYHPGRYPHAHESPATFPVEERKYYDSHVNHQYGPGQGPDPNSGRTNGFNREFGFWNAAESLRPRSLLLSAVFLSLILR